MTQFFLVGDYRSDLLDMLEGIADADSNLVHEDWVADAVDDMDSLTAAGRVTLVKNYGAKLMDPIPLESTGGPSRFLTYQWIHVRRMLGVTGGKPEASQPFDPDPEPRKIPLHTHGGDCTDAAKLDAGERSSGPEVGPGGAVRDDLTSVPAGRRKVVQLPANQATKASWSEGSSLST